MIYSERLRNIREEINISQYEISQFLNLNKRVYGQYEREYTIMPLKHLVKVCDYFNVSLDYIFGFTDNKSYENRKDGIDNTLLSLRLKEFRKENKLTQTKLGNILNTTKTVICGYEKSRYVIASPFLYTICKKYNISADYLLGKVDSPKYLN